MDKLICTIWMDNCLQVSKIQLIAEWTKISVHRAIGSLILLAIYLPLLQLFSI
jgi:hypothetical protein